MMDDQDDLNEQVRRIINSQHLAPDTDQHPLQPGMTRVIHIRVSTYDVPKGEEDKAIAADLEEQEPMSSTDTSAQASHPHSRQHRSLNLTPWVMTAFGLSTFLLGAVTILAIMLLTLMAHLLR